MTGEFKIWWERKRIRKFNIRNINKYINKKIISWTFHCRKMWDIMLRDKFQNFSLGWKED